MDERRRQASTPNFVRAETTRSRAPGSAGPQRLQHTPGMNAGHRAVATLVERRTRHLRLVRLGGAGTAASLRAALAESLLALPDGVCRSLTWDHGKEMPAHYQLTDSTGVAIFFCECSSPWERGTNENTDGLPRQYSPKGTDPNAVTQAELDRIADGINGQPRRNPGRMIS